MRELQVPQQPQFVALAHAEGGGAPLADAVEGQDGGALERAGKKGAGRMALMMIGEHQPGVAGGVEAPAQSAPHVEFFL